MDYAEIFLKAPMPIMVIQDGIIVYANPAFLEIMEWAGYAGTLESVQGLELFQLVAPEERVASRKNVGRLLSAADPVHRNISRTLVDAKGRRYDALVSVSQIEWEDQPALEASFVLLGRKDLGVGETAAAARFDRDHRRSALEALTPKEREVAELVAAGYSTDNIRAHLGVKDSTVRSHIKAIFRKTDTHSRAALTRFFIGVRVR